MIPALWLLLDLLLMAWLIYQLIDKISFEADDKIR